MVLEFRITRIIFNKDNFYICQIITSNKVKTSIKGNFKEEPNLDFKYIVEADLFKDLKYGDNYILRKIISSEIIPEEDDESKVTVIKEMKNGIIRFLSSDMFFGIGEKTATKIYDVLGSDCLEIIRDNQDILNSFLPKSKSNLLYAQIKKKQEKYDNYSFLYKIGFTETFVEKILKEFQNDSRKIISNDPYILIDKIDGIGFPSADKVSKRLGIDKNSIKRLRAAFIYCIKQICIQSGNSYTDLQEIKGKIDALLLNEYNDKVDKEALENAYISLIDDDTLMYDNSNDRLYYKDAYLAETRMKDDLIRIRDSFIKSVDENIIINLIKEVENTFGIIYSSEQISAITNCFTNGISIITGGPGTGKTTIIRAILYIFDYLNKNNYSFLYKNLAPTGRAAKRLNESTGKLNASTIHRALGYGRERDKEFLVNRNNKFSENVFIIDESSMIDVFLGDSLFQSINNNSIVVIVGDVDQLPSVSIGMFLRDIIESNVFVTTRLNIIRRQKEGSGITILANDINKSIFDSANINKYTDCVFIEKLDSLGVFQIVEKHLKEGIDLDDIQILCPKYKGELGIDKLNSIIQDKLVNKNNDYIQFDNVNYYFNDKILQIKNLKTADIMNGDIGYIDYISPNQPKHINITFSNNSHIYYIDEFDKFRLGYAMSIHKSQGSEFKVVILILIDNFLFNRKEIYYTAVSRAKEKLYVIGDTRVLDISQKRSFEVRKTLLKELLIENK